MRRPIHIRDKTDNVKKIAIPILILAIIIKFRLLSQPADQLELSAPNRCFSSRNPNFKMIVYAQFHLLHYMESLKTLLVTFFFFCYT